MVDLSVRAFVTGDNEAAAATRVNGEAVARLKTAIDDRLIAEMHKKTQTVSEALELILAARDFERIAARAVALVAQRTRYRARRLVSAPL